MTNLSRKRAAVEDVEPTKKAKIVIEEPVIKNAPVNKVENNELLEKILLRLKSRNMRLLRVSPIPKHCPISLLLELCPLAYAVQFPVFRNSCSYAFLVFRNEKDVAKAEKSLSGMKLNGKDIKCVRALQKIEPESLSMSKFEERVLQVLDLPEGTSKFDLGTLFPKAKDITINKYSDGKICTSCQLTFSSHEEALAAFNQHQETKLKNSTIYVNFKLKRLGKKDAVVKKNVNLKKIAEEDNDEDSEEFEDSDDDMKQSMEVDENSGQKNKKKNKKSKGPVTKQPYQKKMKGAPKKKKEKN